MQSAEPWGDQVATPHVEQAMDPNVSTYFPASQAMQADCPVNGLKWPRLHMAHSDADVAAVVAELFPTSHAVHESVPLEVL
jgi:hypothetical protein